MYPIYKVGYKPLILAIDPNFQQDIQGGPGSNHQGWVKSI